MTAAANEDKKNQIMKQNKKTHLRSLTQQKGAMDGVEQISHAGQRNGGRRQPSASGVSGKGKTLDNDDIVSKNQYGAEPNSGELKQMQKSG